MPNTQAYNENKHIYVIDSIMGSGKSTWVLNYLNETYLADLANTLTNPNHTPTKFLIVVSLLSEVDRFIEACPDLNLQDPQPIQGRKLRHLDTLVAQGSNIATTHSLFSMLNNDIYLRLKKEDYTLIIDECLDAVSIFDGLTNSDRHLLIKEGMIVPNPTNNRLEWNYDRYHDYDGKFSAIKSLCDTGSLVLFRDTVFIWQFPSEFLSCFNKVYIATYLYEGSPFSAYLKSEGFKVSKFYTVMDVEASEEVNKPVSHLLPFDSADGLINHRDSYIRCYLSGLIDVYEGPYNEIGNNPTSSKQSKPLSKGWYDKATDAQLDVLKKATYNFFKRYARTRPVKMIDPDQPESGRVISIPSNGWTCFGKKKKYLKGDGYTKGFIANNTRATNKYAHMTSMAFLCNWYLHPYIKGYFQEAGVEINEEAHALSTLIQWLWRSAIRNEKPIKIFIPSERMRTLFKDWLSGKDLVQEGSPLSQHIAEEAEWSEQHPDLVTEHQNRLHRPIAINLHAA